MTVLRERHKQDDCEADIIDTSHRGGQVRSSDDVAVMAMERRDLVTTLRVDGQLETGGAI